MNNKFANIQKAMDDEMVNDPNLKRVIGFCFKDNSNIEIFIRKCLKKNKTRWMLNRVQWISELADSQKYDSVRLFFLIAMAEVIVKLSDGRFKKNDPQTVDVKSFFNSFSFEDKKRLRECFFKSDKFMSPHSLRFPTIINVLLNVRHRLAHGKSHYDFVFHSGQENLWNPIWGEIGPTKYKKRIRYELTLTYVEFRKIMIKNSILYIQKHL